MPSIPLPMFACLQAARVPLANLWIAVGAYGQSTITAGANQGLGSTFADLSFVILAD